MIKRFIEFMTQNSDDGELNCGFSDIVNNEWYHTKDRVNAKKCVDLLNELDEKYVEEYALRETLQQELQRVEEEKEQLKKDVDYWKQVASQCSNELNVFEHCKKYKTECKDIHWSSD